VVRESRRAVGAIIVHRDREEGRFNMQDKRHLASMAPFMAHVVNAAGETHGTLVDDSTSGLVIANRQGKLQYISPDAQRLLFLATHPRVSASTFTQAYGNVELPPALRQVCQNLIDVFEGKRCATEPVWRHHNPWGGFNFRAHWLKNNGLNDGGANDDNSEPAPLIGITIQHEVPLSVKLLARLEQFPLSRRQMDI